MAVRFVMGRAGTGKTRHCFDAIVAAMRAEPLGPPIYWIVPKQATFSAERALATESGLDAFCRARVLSFELLGEEVLAACGGAAIPEVSSLGRQMLIGHLLRSRQNDLKFFRGVARQPGLVARLDATFAEFERCGNDPSSLADAIDQLAPADASASDDHVESTLLADKLRDFHLLYKAYHETLGNERVDPHRRLEQVLTCIGEHGALRGASVFIDGFLEFTDRERRMIVALAQSALSVDITLLIDPKSKTISDIHSLPDDLSLFHRSESQFRLLMLALQQAGIVCEPPVLLKTPKRYANDAMTAIERSCFDGKREVHAPPPPSLKLVEAPDRRTEVDAAARRIRAMVLAKVRYRDMAVLVRDIDDYEQLISASFREHDIPYFVDRRKPAAHHPLLQFTRAVLLIARHNWPHEAVMTLLKSGLAGVSLDHADELENYILLHRLRGSAWTDAQPWIFNRQLTRQREDEAGDYQQSEPARMDSLRRTLVDNIAPFAAVLRADSRPTVRDIVRGLFKLFDAFGVATTVGSWIDAADAANDPQHRGEHEQVWAELVEMFDQMVDLLGDERVDLADFMDILDVGLEQFDLALTPPRVDQVLVGQVDRTRTTSLDTVFVLGLSEGQFPRIAREDSVLSDSERRSLRGKNLEIDPESERRQLDENLFGYIAFTRASRRLIVCRPTSHENKPINPSSFWSRLTSMFPGTVIAHEKRESEAGPEAIGTPRQLVTGLIHWARKDESADGDQPWASLYQFLADHEKADDAIGVMRYKAWRALDYRNEATLSPAVAKLLVPAALSASVTRIETFAACPFKHFARYHLGLEQREEADVTPMDLGNVYHNILERLVRQNLEKRQDWCDLKPAVTEQLIEQFAGEIGKTLRGELMLSSARNQYLLKRIRKTLEQVCATQKAVLSRGTLRPIYAELNFGMGENALPPLTLTTPAGREVRLRGKIDRVDKAVDGGEIAVIDYKMSNNRLRLHAVFHGLSLQLLTYLLVLQASGEELFKSKVTPVAAFYAKLLRGFESIDHPDQATDPADPIFDLRTKPRGIFDLAYLNHLDADHESGDSEVVQVFVKQDGSLGRLDSSDAAEADTFAALLRYVQKRIGELADQLIGGRIAVNPYRIGLETPCPNCEFRAICRFDPGINQYLNLPAMKRSTVLETILKGTGDEQ